MDLGHRFISRECGELTPQCIFLLIICSLLGCYSECCGILRFVVDHSWFEYYLSDAHTPCVVQICPQVTVVISWLVRWGEWLLEFICQILYALRRCLVIGLGHRQIFFWTFSFSTSSFLFRYGLFQVCLGVSPLSHLSDQAQHLVPLHHHKHNHFYLLSAPNYSSRPFLSQSSTFPWDLRTHTNIHRYRTKKAPFQLISLAL